MYIKLLKRDSRIGSKPWIILGDFNQTLHPEEHSKPVSLNIDAKTRLFREALLEAKLEDLTYKGPKFTWSNKSKTSPLAKKLDRVLVNEEWLSFLPSSYVVFGELDFSDHAVCGVSLSLLSTRGKRSFRFQNFLLKNDAFLEFLAGHWFSMDVSGSAMFRISKKLKILKREIKTFSRDNYSGLEKRVSEAHEKLLIAQQHLLMDPNTANAVTESEAHEKWPVLAKAEELFLFQRSHIQWNQLGDSNTAYYHRMVANRKAINHIHYLLDASGNRVEGQADVQSLCISYFANLMGDEQSPPLFDPQDLAILMPYRCSQDQRSSLTKEFTREDIRDAFLSLPSNKTSGPDGYSAEFFTASWSVIGAEATDAVLEFFRSGKLLKQWNITSLILIPKIINAESAKDFRPISCVNTIYKVISKLLTKRLQDVLIDIISPYQSAFIKGRVLAENVLMATEMVHGYNRRSISRRGMLKVDLKKAFDSIRWDFILATLRAIEFPEQYIIWIEECITTPTFSVTVNGVSDGYYKSTKGLRQGDPLSPYLFVLAMEVFSRLLSSRFNSGLITYHPKAAETDLSHLMFADDVMIFFDGGAASLHSITETLDDFASWSGLQVNREKSELFLAGLSTQETTEIARYEYPIGKLPIRYLGLPLMHRKFRISEYEPLLNKLATTFRSWAVKMLSYAGRLQLLSSVINGIICF